MDSTEFKFEVISPEDIGNRMNDIQKLLKDNDIPYESATFIALLGLGIGVLKRAGVQREDIKMMFDRLLVETTWTEIH